MNPGVNLEHKRNFLQAKTSFERKRLYYDLSTVLNQYRDLDHYNKRYVLGLLLKRLEFCENKGLELIPNG